MPGMRSTDRFCLPVDIESYVDRLAGRLRPLFILLFDSQVRGTAGRHSDYDLFVVAPDLPTDYWKRLDLLWADKPVWVDVIAFTPEELAQVLHRGLVLDALLDGVLLWGDERSFTQWRGQGQAYIESQGLRKTPWGYFKRAA